MGFVLLLIIGGAALLPITGGWSHASCAWQSAGPAASTSAALQTLSLSLRTPDVGTGTGLRQRLEEGLKGRGVKELVDNPKTYPRAQITVTEMDGRWTPFWARLRLKANVVVDRKKDKQGHDVNVDVVVEGSCSGLVTRDEWQASALDVLAKDILAHVGPSI